jgi:hypothetical protein
VNRPSCVVPVPFSPMVGSSIDAQFTFHAALSKG